jgi:ribosomal protein S18 acetylase RimI-like enzyme
MEFIDGIRIAPEDMVKTLGGGEAAVLVAKHGDRLAGCIKIEQLDSGDAEVGMFAVDPDFQSSGVGRALLDAAHSFAKEVLDVKNTGRRLLR